MGLLLLFFFTQFPAFGAPTCAEKISGLKIEKITAHAKMSDERLIAQLVSASKRISLNAKWREPKKIEQLSDTVLRLEFAQGKDALTLYSNLHAEVLAYKKGDELWCSKLMGEVK